MEKIKPWWAPVSESEVALELMWQEEVLESIESMSAEELAYMEESVESEWNEW